MAPFLISGIASLADTVLQNLTRPASANVATQNQVDFQAMLDKTASDLTTRFNASLATPPTAEAAAQRLNSLPEVQAALNGSQPGQPTTFAVSPDGQLSRVLSNGANGTLVLSSQSQALVQQLAASVNHGGGFGATLTARILS